MAKDPKIDLLGKVPLFAACDPRALQRIAQLADEVDVPAGREIITQGARGQEFFVVIDGRVDVERNGRHVATLGPGDFLGEIALVDDHPRSATATVTEPSRLLVVGHREFHALMDEYPAVQLAVLQALARRVRALDDQEP